MTKPINTDMQSYWNGEAGSNWVNFQSMLDKGLKTFGRQALAVANIRSGERVLDVGCGCGDTSIEIASMVSESGQVHGIDISDIVLQRARARANSVSQNNIHFELADAQFHQFKATRFDVVFSRFGVMFFDDPVSAFNNIRKAMKPSGHMAFICWQPIQKNRWVSLPLAIVKNHIELPLPPEPDQPGPFSLADKNRVERILGEAGFTHILVQHFDCLFNIGESLDDAVNFLINIGPASSAIKSAEVSQPTLVRIMDDLRRALIPYDTGKGVKLSAASWVVTARNA